MPCAISSPTTFRAIGVCVCTCVHVRFTTYQEVSACARGFAAYFPVCLPVFPWSRFFVLVSCERTRVPCTCLFFLSWPGFFGPLFPIFAAGVQGLPGSCSSFSSHSLMPTPTPTRILNTNTNTHTHTGSRGTGSGQGEAQERCGFAARAVP